MHAYGARASHACRSHWGQEPKSRSADIWNPRRVKQYIEISESKYEMPARSRSHLTKKLWPVSYNFELRFCWSHISGTYLGANGQQILVGHVCRISGACLDGNGHRILMLYPCMYVSESYMCFVCDILIPCRQHTRREECADSRCSVYNTLPYTLQNYKPLWTYMSKAL